MSDFEQAVKTAAEKAVLKILSSGDWIKPDYANRFTLPHEWLVTVWRMIDRDRLQAKLTERIEAELADRIVNHIAAELATDIKHILSVQERREAIRALARDHMESIMQAGAKAA